MLDTTGQLAPLIFFLIVVLSAQVDAFTLVQYGCGSSSRITLASFGSQDDSGCQDAEGAPIMDDERRNVLAIPVLTFASVLASSSQPAFAGNSKSRTEGYSVQKTDKEWNEQLSDMQYYVLRRGGTESPNYSVLEGEDREGGFACAGCDTALFESSQKFHSGTGWPSFARILPGVEVEGVNAVAANLVGSEVRCKTCGGHLGDVFNDGFLFVGTPAFASGKRYCIDGAAMVFHPAAQSEPDVLGDITKTKLKPKSSSPSWLDPPKITVQ